ncbi:DUF4365 domain-containing protein [Kribbella shirazensis]|uniref:DUF4365 domain-containing protein n=1 Tax=Kribbella shirazensis TaxID=1105143 RepID=A0A7X6A4S3_9ACTN|nr:DUF4365 domain-containing protein [Kribbella shirazensis]NIK61295.1 hypothetical protein [Kribbella shirazensis]
MSRRMAARGKTGSLGESMAEVIFQKIGWAPPTRFREDIGNDFITFARDTVSAGDVEATFDLAAPVLLQVKSSQEKYVKPKHRVNGRPGWWFEETDTDHFDHWLEFEWPYLLVFVDTANQIGYWAHVHGPAIKKTGKGRKIFVPADQRVDPDALDALNRIANTTRMNGLEGAVWDGKLTDLPPADRLRHALLMSRLVAPHPNRSPSALSTEEAVAMLMRGRFNELVHWSRDGLCPDPKSWATSKNWGWRFAHGLRVLMSENDDSALAALAVTARATFERSATMVVRACLAYISGEPRTALDLLKPTRYTKPADRGWILAQRAHVLLELDQPEEAAAAAKEALFALKALAGDLTVSTIRGGCAALLFSTSEFGRGDIEETIAAQDNAGSWWRAQDVSHALGQDLTSRFSAWSANGDTRFTAANARDDLMTTAWTAAFSGAWGAWRHLALQIGEVTLISTSEFDHVASALNLMALAGDKTEIKKAADRIWVAGPTSALCTVLIELASDPWPKRTEGPAMALFAAGGDLLDAELADRVINRAIALLEDDGPVRQLGGGWASRWNELGGAIPRVLTAASPATHQVIADLIAASYDGDEGVVQALNRIARSLDLAHVEKTTVEHLVTAASERDDHYGLEMLEILGSRLPKAVAELRRRANEGSNAAFRSLLVTGSTQRDDYLALGRSVGKTVKQMLADAAGVNGTFKYSGYQIDQLHDLTLSAYHTGDNRLWKAVTDAVTAGILPGAQVQRTLEMLARHFTKLPAHVQRRLKKAAPTLKSAPTRLFIGESDRFNSAVTALRVAAGTLPEDEMWPVLLELRRTEPVGFVELLALRSSPHTHAFLASATVDPDPEVRAAAGYNLVRYASEHPEQHDTVLATLIAALEVNEGCRMALAIAVALVEYDLPAFGPIADVLATHPSAIVRRHLMQPERPEASRSTT